MPERRPGRRTKNPKIEVYTADLAGITLSDFIKPGLKRARPDVFIEQIVSYLFDVLALTLFQDVKIVFHISIEWRVLATSVVLFSRCSCCNV